MDNATLAKCSSTPFSSSLMADECHWYSYATRTTIYLWRIKNPCLYTCWIVSNQISIKLALNASTLSCLKIVSEISPPKCQQLQVKPVHYCTGSSPCLQFVCRTSAKNPLFSAVQPPPSKAPSSWGMLVSKELGGGMWKRPLDRGVDRRGLWWCLSSLV